MRDVQELRGHHGRDAANVQGHLQHAGQPRVDNLVLVQGKDDTMNVPHPTGLDKLLTD